MHGWPEKFCQPCVLQSIDARAWSIWELMGDCVDHEYIPYGAGGSISFIVKPRISSSEICGRLELRGIPRELWADMDELVMVAFKEYRALRDNKRVFFDEHDLESVRTPKDD